MWVRGDTWFVSVLWQMRVRGSCEWSHTPLHHCLPCEASGSTSSVYDSLILANFQNLLIIYNNEKLKKLNFDNLLCCVSLFYVLWLCMGVWMKRTGRTWGYFNELQACRRVHVQKTSLNNTVCLAIQIEIVLKLPKLWVFIMTGGAQPQKSYLIL